MPLTFSNYIVDADKPQTDLSSQVIEKVCDNNTAKMPHHKRCDEASIPLSQQGLFLCRVALGARPTRKHECNLLDEIRSVVDRVEVNIIDGTEKVMEEVACTERAQPTVTIMRLLKKDTT